MAKRKYNIIREARRKLGITQKELAELVGVHPNTVVNWETFKTFPRIYYYEPLAKVLSLTASELLAEEKLYRGRIVN